MMVAELVNSLGIASVVALLASAVTGIVLRLAASRLDRLDPVSRARAMLVAAMAPCFCAGLYLAGWCVDIAVWGRTELCTAETLERPESVILAAFALLPFMRLAAAGRKLAAAWRLEAALTPLQGPVSEYRLLSTQEPTVFALGFWRPRVYISRGLMDFACASELAPVLAHEQAHCRRRDPLARAVAALGSAFHLPRVALDLEDRLVVAQELAADREAAECLGDPLLVASALVKFARLRVSWQLGAEFASGAIETRIRALLDGPPAGVSVSFGRLATIATACCGLALGLGHISHVTAATLLRTIP